MKICPLVYLSPSQQYQSPDKLLISCLLQKVFGGESIIRTFKRMPELNGGWIQRIHRTPSCLGVGGFLERNREGKEFSCCDGELFPSSTWLRPRAFRPRWTPWDVVFGGVYQCIWAALLCVFMCVCVPRQLSSSSSPLVACNIYN